MHSRYARALLRPLLGPTHKLHSVHAIVSLGGAEAEEQHWRRSRSNVAPALSDGSALPAPLASPGGARLASAAARGASVARNKRPAETPLRVRLDSSDRGEAGANGL